ncbi:unnamed protein product [Fraxinus pennsylvanica]|uniref:TF-B3 domain-containing protein n=1 Tax=Fraxinus pennsylvanica TaxID=56036 RepID=A0AAD1ZKG8_9LAMI|nr:unnamed protein product [Fraxinus pennsylvanica]
MAVQEEVVLRYVDTSSRLLLGKDFMRKHVIPYMDTSRTEKCKTIEGATIIVYDADTESEHLLKLKQWKTKSYVLTSSWRKKFVTRMDLKEDDVLGFKWDDSKFHISMLDRAATSSNNNQEI